MTTSCQIAMPRPNLVVEQWSHGWGFVVGATKFFRCVLQDSASGAGRWNYQVCCRRSITGLRSFAEYTSVTRVRRGSARADWVWGSDDPPEHSQRWEQYKSACPGVVYRAYDCSGSLGHVAVKAPERKLSRIVMCSGLVSIPATSAWQVLKHPQRARRLDS